MKNEIPYDQMTKLQKFKNSKPMEFRREMFLRDQNDTSKQDLTCKNRYIELLENDIQTFSEKYVDSHQMLQKLTFVQKDFKSRIKQNVTLAPVIEVYQ